MRAKLLRGPLRHRLAVALAGLTALALVSLGLVYGITEHVIEQRALRLEMTAEIQSLIERWERGDSALLVSTTLRYFPAGEVPVALASLPPDDFRQLRFEGRTAQVITAADDAGGLHVLVQDLNLMEQRERMLLLSLSAGVVVALLGAWWVSGRLARHILSPLTNLVGDIRRVDPAKPALSTLDRTGDEELDAIPDAINSLIRELDHVLERERAFADAASHELRTPLAVVRGAIDVLRERGDAPAHIVDRIDRAARRAEEDLRALLALSPAREPAAPKLVDLRILLPATAEPHMREADVKTRVVWEWGDDTNAHVEPATLAIVFTNLLRNALRAAPQGEIRIRADRTVVEVVDDGEGLPEGWPGAVAPRGRGLGLSLASALAERHGWDLEVTRAEPRGTRACLAFERARERDDRPRTSEWSRTLSASR